MNHSIRPTCTLLLLATASCSDPRGAAPPPDGATPPTLSELRVNATEYSLPLGLESELGATGYFSDGPAGT